MAAIFEVFLSFLVTVLKKIGSLPLIISHELPSKSNANEDHEICGALSTAGVIHFVQDNLSVCERSISHICRKVARLERVQPAGFDAPNHNTRP
jgi:hypothetical protein